MMLYLVALVLLPFFSYTSALYKRQTPSVNLSYATVVGSSALGIDSFKGIPFAQPPTGQLRLKPPQSINSSLGTIDATGVPTSCPQFLFSDNSSDILSDVIADLEDTYLAQVATDTSEDCLTLNVQRPANVSSSSKLPVLFWIYGGGFEFGSTQVYDGSSIVTKSVAQGQPLIFVAVNYRVGGFGFMPGKEILADGSSNIGLLDQRLALQWVADNIAEFGGDPSKVTIWGESAGSISVADQMLLNGGDNTYNGQALFRAAIMNSGSIVPTTPIDSAKPQSIYDQVVSSAGCSNSSDTLACLRSLPYTQFLNACNSVPGLFDYNGVALSYQPRPDYNAKVLPESPELLVQAGKYANVPFIIGDQEDEGTLFSLVQSNLTTTSDVVTYLSTEFFPTAPTSVVEGLVATYPDDPTVGSPYNTGIANQVYPEFKRLASILGDLLFILSRRGFLSTVNTLTPSLPVWSYLASYDYGTPILGTFHGSDLPDDFGWTPGFPSTSIQTYYISFVNTLDPNNGSTGFTNWPQWDNDGLQLLSLEALDNSLTTDDFREESYEYITANSQYLRA